MAAPDRREGSSVIQTLLEQGYRFDFFQAVRVLEAVNARPPGDGRNRDGLRFASSVGFNFPASDIAEVSHEEGEPYRLLVNFLGLAGEHGPLPTPFSERVLDRLRERDPTMRDFLDIFNHRLVTLMYRVRKKHRPALCPPRRPKGRVPEWEREGGSLFTLALFALMGLVTPRLQGCFQLPRGGGLNDRSLLAYAGLLAQRPRSLHGFERLLSTYFNVPVRGHPLKGCWRALEEDQTTVLGRGGRNRCLGRDTVAGRHFWDWQGRVEMELGPLSYDLAMAMMPPAPAFAPLVQMARFYFEDAMEVDFRFIVREDREVPQPPKGEQGRFAGGRGKRPGWFYQVPTSQISAKPPRMRLGWNSWLKVHMFEEEKGDLVLRWESALAELERMGHAGE